MKVPAAPAPRVTKRRAQTRARLVSAASEVFAEKGFGRATVEDVCERAGFTRGAFYSNFASLDELFFALYADRSARLVLAVSSAVAAMAGEDLATAPRGSALQAVVDRVLAALPIDREQHLLNLEFTAYALRNPEVAATLSERRRDLRQALIPILRNGLGRSAVDRTGRSAVDRTGREWDNLSRAVIAVHDGLFVQELLEPDTIGLPTLRRDVLTTLLSGLRS